MPDDDSMLGQNLVDVRNEGRRSALRGEQLFTVPAKLPQRQQDVFDLVAGDGATDLQVGFELHTRKGCRHCVNSRHGYCDYAASDARKVLQALRKKGLVVRRRSGMWQRVGEPSASASSSSQTDVFPEGF